MCLFKKKKVSIEQKRDKDNDLLKNNIAKSKVLCVASKNEEIIKRVKSITDKLQYSSPSRKESVEKIDKKLSNKLDDLKILILGEKSEVKILELLDEIDVIVAERESTLEAGI